MTPLNENEDVSSLAISTEPSRLTKPALMGTKYVKQNK